MKKFASAIAVLGCLTAFGDMAASADPIVLTGTSVPAFGLANVSDSFQIFVNNNIGPSAQYRVFETGLGSEASCNDPVAILGGCSFSTDTLVVNSVTISPNPDFENKVAVFFEPNSTVISDIFLLGCNGTNPNRDTSTGLCLSGHAPNFTIITANQNTGFISYSDLVAGLPSFGLSVYYTGTELAGPVTQFDITSFIVTNNTNSDLHFFAKFASANDVPEPVTLSVFSAGLAGAVALRRRKQKKG